MNSQTNTPDFAKLQAKFENLPTEKKPQVAVILDLMVKNFNRNLTEYQAELIDNYFDMKRSKAKRELKKRIDRLGEVIAL